MPSSTTLYEAVIKNDIGLVKRFLQKYGGDVNEINDDNRRSLISMAALSGSVDMVELLWEEGALFNNAADLNGDFTIHCAVTGGSKEVVSFIFKKSPEEIFRRNSKTLKFADCFKEKDDVSSSTTMPSLDDTSSFSLNEDDDNFIVDDDDSILDSSDSDASTLSSSDASTLSSSTSDSDASDSDASKIESSSSDVDFIVNKEDFTSRWRGDFQCPAMLPELLVDNNHVSDDDEDDDEAVLIGENDVIENDNNKKHESSSSWFSSWFY